MPMIPISHAKLTPTKNWVCRILGHSHSYEHVKDCVWSESKHFNEGNPFTFNCAVRTDYVWGWIGDKVVRRPTLEPTPPIPRECLRCGAAPVA